MYYVCLVRRFNCLLLLLSTEREEFRRFAARKLFAKDRQYSALTAKARKLNKQRRRQLRITSEVRTDIKVGS